MLRKKYTRLELISIIGTKEEFAPYPDITQREKWETIHPDVKSLVITKADAFLDMEWPALTLTQYIDYTKSGSRKAYSEPSTLRRQMLLYFLAAECLEDSGKYMDAIIDAVWSMCEQSTWVDPAHMQQTYRTKHDIITNVEDILIDLTAGEIASLLTCCHYLLKPKLDNISPLICKRIKYELKRRIYEPFLKRVDLWWMGYDKSTNNWAPWCLSNILLSILLLEDAPDMRMEVVYKSLYILDHFLDEYHEDGGCEEGAVYWQRAAGSLFECLDLIYYASNRQINFYDDPKIRNMALYISKVHINDYNYVNFADGSPRINFESDIIYRFGERVHDNNLMAFGSWLQKQGGPEMVHRNGNSIMRMLLFMFGYEKVMSDTHVLECEEHSWLRGIQVMIARENANNKSGLFLATKGGHNNESHNHNDLGHFVVYADGQPVLIDIGSGTYTKQTFGPDRYKIFTMQSDYHNVPKINGISQSFGKQYHVAHAECQYTNTTSSLTLDLKNAYPEEAGINTWNRSFSMERGKNRHIDIIDDFLLESPTKEIDFYYITCVQPLINDGVIFLHYDMECPEKAIAIYYDHYEYEVTYETIELEDPTLIRNWSDRLYRLTMKPKHPMDQGYLRLELRKNTIVSHHD